LLYKNLPPKYLYRTISFRFILDYLAVARFVISLQTNHASAVIKAHYHFFKSFALMRAKRKKVFFAPDADYTSCVYLGSIVLEYFMGNKKKFEQLNKMAMNKKVQPKKSGSGRYPGPGYDEAAEARKLTKLYTEQARAADKKSAPKKNAGVKSTNNKLDDLVSTLTKNYRVTAKEASSMIKFIGDTAGGFKQGLKGVDFTKEIPKYIGGAVKANVQLPGTIAKMAKRNAKQTINEFKKGYNKK
jgi:hypothetical protein